MKGVAKLVLATKSHRDFIILRNPYFLPFPSLPIACRLNSHKGTGRAKLHTPTLQTILKGLKGYQRNKNS